MLSNNLCPVTLKYNLLIGQVRPYENKMCFYLIKIEDIL